MSIWAIVPVKPLKQAKSRLAPLLSLAEREALSREYLLHTLEVLEGVGDVARALVTSRDPAVLRLTRSRNGQAVAESGTLELNAALSRATDVAVSQGARAVLVLPTDLPLLTAADVRQVIAAASEAACVAIAPDRREEGTNALFARPPRLIPYAFGPGSFHRHVALARERGACLEVCRLPNLALDVDVPADLELVWKRTSDPRAAAAASGYAEIAGRSP